MKTMTLAIPDNWLPTNDWDSHRPLLYIALSNTAGSVIEFGCGYGSTPLIQRYCEANSRLFISYETNGEWAKEFDTVCILRDYLEYEPKTLVEHQPGVVFIDSAPGEGRKQLIDAWKNWAEVLVVHDTEPGAEYVYAMSEVLCSFKFRCDLKPEGMPQTTVVSNFVDVSAWKGDYNQKYKVV